MKMIGIDIGGANLKFSDGDQQHISCPFELWRRPATLASELAKHLEPFGHAGGLAVTMTGELCDCFATRQEGVAQIVAAVRELAGEWQEPVFYQVGGDFVDAATAIAAWQRTAAANWDAIARFNAGQFPEESGWVIDIGSTTTDLLRIARGKVVARGHTDFERLRWGELVYCGASRTPLNALLSELVQEEGRWGLAAEWFASLDDVFLLCGDLRESSGASQTCDGRPLTREWSLRRLGRMLCSEPEEAGEQLIIELAEAIKRALLERLAAAWKRQAAGSLAIRTDERVVLSGSGEWLGRQLLEHVGWSGGVSSWGERFTPTASAAAAAFAVARLAAVQLGSSCPLNKMDTHRPAQILAERPRKHPER